MPFLSVVVAIVWESGLRGEIARATEVEFARLHEHQGIAAAERRVTINALDLTIDPIEFDGRIELRRAVCREESTGLEFSAGGPMQVEFTAVAAMNEHGASVEIVDVDDYLSRDPHEGAWRMLNRDPEGAAVKAFLYYWNHGELDLAPPRLIVLTSALRRQGRWQDAARMAVAASEENPWSAEVWTERLAEERRLIASHVDGKTRQRLRRAVSLDRWLVSKNDRRGV